MGNILCGLSSRIVVLAATGDKMENYIFGLEPQLLMDALIQALAVFILFIILSYLLFNPARDLLRKRREKVQGELEFSAKQKEQAMELKDKYEDKLANASAKVDEILSEGRKKALLRENEIVAGANEEAQRIMERAAKEIELEKSKAKDDMKKQMITVATAMAGRVIANGIDETKQSKLIEDALNEMGDDTWAE